MSTKLIQILLILAIANKSLQLDFECSFVLSTGSNLYCEAYKTWNEQVSAVKFVNGTHYEGDTNEQVNSVSFTKAHRLNHFPRNLREFFPNLIAIYIYDCNISKMLPSDLKAYSELEVLYIKGSPISSIPGDLFKYNNKLMRICIDFNHHLQHVGLNLIENLKNLEYVSFFSNECINFIADTPEKISDLSEKLAESCPPEHHHAPSSRRNRECDCDKLQELVKKQQKMIERLMKMLRDKLN